MSDDGHIVIFRAAIKPFRKEDLGSPDRLAAILLHETIHWVDRKAFDDRFWTHEAHKTEARGYRAEIEFIKRIRDEARRTVLSDDDLHKLELKVIHHDDAIKRIPNQDSWAGIGEYYRIDRFFSKDRDEPGPEGGYSAELLKTQAGRDFAAAWDRRAANLLDRIRQYNAEHDDEDQARRKQQADLGRRLQAETAFSRLEAFSTAICRNGEGMYRVMVSLTELEQIWAALGPTPSGSDPEPYLGLWDCPQWLSHKLDRLHSQVAACPDRAVLWELLQRHDEVVASRKQGVAHPVTATPPLKATPSTPPSSRPPQTRTEPGLGDSQIIPAKPEPPDRERCIYQGDWCR